ncbi:hypothetical protein Efla_005347 [Eimeria flavescens]
MGSAIGEDNHQPAFSFCKASSSEDRAANREGGPSTVPWGVAAETIQQGAPSSSKPPAAAAAAAAAAAENSSQSFLLPRIRDREDAGAWAGDHAGAAAVARRPSQLLQQRRQRLELHQKKLKLQKKTAKGELVERKGGGGHFQVPVRNPADKVEHCFCDLLRLFLILLLPPIPCCSLAAAAAVAPAPAAAATVSGGQLERLASEAFYPFAFLLLRAAAAVCSSPTLSQQQHTAAAAAAAAAAGVKMSVLSVVLQLLVLLVSLAVPTGVSVHLLATGGRGAEAAATSCRLLQYFFVFCCLQHLLHAFPVSVLLKLLPDGLVLLLKLLACAALAHPKLRLPERIVAFTSTHYQEYLQAAVSTAEEKVLKPLKANVKEALNAAKMQSEEQQQEQKH